MARPGRTSVTIAIVALLRENPTYVHVHAYVTELALAAEPGTTRERLVNQPSSVPEQYDAVVVAAGFQLLASRGR